jgi:K+-transporting ATPase ATPase C chain
MKTFVIALRVTVVTLVLTGLVYPFVSTGLAKLIFPHQAEGSLISDGKGSVVGSELIGQAFADPKFFWGRPSAAGAGYDPQASSPSNLGPTSQKLADSFGVEAAKARADGVVGPIPADRLTGSGSGLDPDISLENALGQCTRVARARGLGVERLRALVQAHVQGRSLGLFGEPRVNVLELNRAVLDIEPR